MENEDLIAVEVCCAHYSIETSFVRSLISSGLLEPVTIGEVDYLQREHMSDLEKMIRLYYEMDINIEGIEVISHLLSRINQLQEEIRVLQNRLRLYED